MTNLTGKNFIGPSLSSESNQTFLAEDPSTATKLPTSFHEATDREVDRAVQLAEKAFSTYSKMSGAKKANFLESIADEIIALGDSLINRCCAESGLPAGRITGERGRTTNQLKLFASLLRKGDWVDARIDFADPNRQPNPKVDIRSMQKAIGPVGIFGASNFPLAFSVAGGDTASALAAGCSVVVKAHPAHPGTCELIAKAINAAIKKTDMPEGVFSMVHGTSHEVGMAIVKHPLIKAIGFTGSFRGGKAIYDAAAARPEPIPVYAEMGSTNPVFILPMALKNRGLEIAQGLSHSVNLGVGQFCTNPGLVIHEASAVGNDFLKELCGCITKVEASTMLTGNIHKAYNSGIEDLKQNQAVEQKAQGGASALGYRGRARLLSIDQKEFSKDPKLEEEVFGPSTLTIAAKDKEAFLKIARHLNGHLTATLFGESDELLAYQELLDLLERKVGRLIINGFPTGVEVCDSMVHGGPFPATTNSRSTSVGTGAITRFTRPVCYQNFPDELLPDELKNNNPLDINRIEIGKV